MDRNQLACGSLRDHPQHVWPEHPGPPKYTCKGSSTVDQGDSKMAEKPFDFSVEHDGSLSTASAVFQALGYASTCWENMSGTGVFQSERAKQAGDRLMELLQKRGVSEQDGKDGTLTVDGVARKYAAQLYVLQQWLTTYDKANTVALTEDGVVPRVIQLLQDRVPDRIRQVTLRVALYDWIENSHGITRLAEAMAAERGLVIVDSPTDEPGDEGTVILAWPAREHPEGRKGAEAIHVRRTKDAYEKEGLLYQYPLQREAWDALGEEGQKTMRSWLMSWLAKQDLGVDPGGYVEATTDYGVILGMETVTLNFVTMPLRLPTTLDLEVVAE